MTIMSPFEVDRAADILEEMEPDDAADLINELPAARAGSSCLRWSQRKPKTCAVSCPTVSVQPAA